ncbi:Myb family transcription factor, partial [Musa troglodytarum]
LHQLLHHPPHACHLLSSSLPNPERRSQQGRRERRQLQQHGKSPCCDKAKVKKGPKRTPSSSPKSSSVDRPLQKIGLKRCGKSCLLLLRWLNYLRPNIKHGGLFEEQDAIICNLYISIGGR